jgi:hypothetical protein
LKEEADTILESLKEVLEQAPQIIHPLVTKAYYTHKHLEV